MLPQQALWHFDCCTYIDQNNSLDTHKLHTFHWTYTAHQSHLQIENVYTF